MSRDAKSSSAPNPIDSRSATAVDSATAPLPRTPLGPQDFYMEGAFLVFTAAYHLRRGYCCNSNCRHCPYKEFEE